MNRRYISNAVAAACVFALPAAADDSAALSASALAYLDETIATARAQAAAAPGDPGFVAFIAGDDRWLNPRIPPGIGSLATHFGLYGAGAAVTTGTLMATDAARVSVTVSYDRVPGFAWPARVDFLLVDGAWKLREVALTQRRPQPVTASPDDVLVAYLEGLQAAVARHATLTDGSWSAQALAAHWRSGGGYWRQMTDCPAEIRAECQAAPAGAAGLWATLALDRDKSVEITDFGYGDEDATGEITVTIPRRTMTETRIYDVTLARDKRHGWQIAGVELRHAPAPETTVALDIDASDGTALVVSLLDALTGPDAPNPAALLQNPGAIEPFFADSREGRKAMAQMATLNMGLVVLGARPGSHTVSLDPDGRVRASFEADRGTPPGLLFTIEAGDAGPTISEVARE